MNLKGHICRFAITLILSLAGSSYLLADTTTKQWERHYCSGIELFYNDQLEEALTEAQKANQFVDELDQEDQFYQYLLLARVYDSKKENLFTEKYGLKALSVGELVFIDGHPLFEELYHYLGIAYCYTNHFDESVYYLNLVKNVAEKRLAQDELLMGSIYTNLARSYGYAGRNDSSIHYFRKAVDIQLKAVGEGHINTAESYQQLGFSFGNKGDYEKELLYLEKALRIRQKLLGSIHPDIVRTYNAIGACHYNFDNTEKAEYYFKKALATMDQYPEHWGKREVDSIQYVNLHQSLAVLYMQEAKYHDAAKLLLYAISRLPYFHQSSALAGRIKCQLGTCLVKQHKTAEAQRYLYEGLNHVVTDYKGPHPNVVKAYLSAGNFYQHIQEWDSSLYYYNLAHLNLFSEPDSLSPESPLSSDVSSELLLIEALNGKASVLYKKNQIATRFYEADSNSSPKWAITELEAALAYYWKIADIIESDEFSQYNEQSRLVLLESVVPNYEKAIQIALVLYELEGDESYFEQALQFAERSRNNLLRTSLTQKDLRRNSTEVGPELIEQERQLITEIAVLKRKLLHDEHQEHIKESLFKKQGELDQLKEQINNVIHHSDSATVSIAIKNIQQNLLQPNQLIIEYFTGDSSLYVFAISSKDISYHNISINPNFYSRLKLIQRSLSDFDWITDSSVIASQAYSTSAYDLYNKLLKSVLQYHNTKGNLKSLLIIPDGPLSYLPFEVLLTKQAKNPLNYRELEYLLYEFDVLYNYSISSALQTSTRSNKTKNSASCLAFAPDYKDTSGLRTQGDLRFLRDANQPLPGALKEVKEIGRFFEGQFFFGRDATETNFKELAGDFDILHLAMHGQIDDRHPSYSRLLFAQNDSVLDDGHLYSYELGQMELNASLMILSACQTGVGEYYIGEGVTSLGRRAIEAGAQNVIYTFWRVNDQSSETIMSKFYKHLAQGRSINQSLRMAKIEYLNNCSSIMAHPFFWAGFAHLGKNEAKFQTSLSDSSDEFFWGNRLSYIIIGSVFLLLVAACVRQFLFAKS